MTNLPVEYKAIVMQLIRALRTSGRWNKESSEKSGLIFGLPLILGVADHEAMVFTLANKEADWSITLNILERIDTYVKDFNMGDVTGNTDACIRDLIYAKMAFD